MNKKDLLAKLKQLEGLTPDERAELINLLNTKKKYGLIWEDKPEDVEEQLRTQLPVLREVVEKRILATKSESDTATTKTSNNNLFSEEENQENKENQTNHSSDNGLLSEVEAPNHILIEGDNLHALTALTFTHEGKIDVIYIDPPYNTGNKDFKYNDAFVDKEDSYRHSKWLSFMHKRLEIAKRLLSDKGVIFISIDDNEQAQLKMLCDEVFGENNFIGDFIWIKKKKGSHLSKTLRSMTEYVLCYSKLITQIELFGEEAYSDKWQPLVKRTNSIKELIFPSLFLKTTLPAGNYIGNRYGRGTSSIFIKSDFTVKDGKILESLIVEAPFVWTQKKLNEEISLGSEISLSSQFGFNTLRYNQDEKIKRPSSLINNENQVGTNEDAYQELIDIFNYEGVMTYPKPTSLIKYLVNTLTYFTKNDKPIILDFFAGTGTTLHATMQLNAEDGGNRQCILVTNNENNICEEVTYERNKRVIKGYTNAKGVQVEGLTNNNLRYYRSEYVGREKTHKNKRELVLAATELLCIKEDIYTELAELDGHKLDKKTIRCFSDKGRYLMVIYDEETIETLLPLISAIDTHHKIKIYIFAPGQYPFTEEFEDVLDKVELCALPDAIYKAYSNVLPKKKAKSVENSDEESTETGENKEPNLFTE